MKTFITLTVTLLLTTLLTTTLIASNGTRPLTVQSTIELKQISNNTILISADLHTTAQEVYTIEKSTNGLHYSTVAIVFAADAADNINQPVLLKNTCNAATTVHYRVTKTNNNVTSIVAKGTITLK